MIIDLRDNNVHAASVQVTCLLPSLYTRLYALCTPANTLSLTHSDTIYVQRAVGRVREADRREVRLCDVLDVSGSSVLAMYGPLKGGVTGLSVPTGALVKVCVHRLYVF